MYHINKEIKGNGENITLKNTAKSYFKAFEIQGNSEQETRSGKNLINIQNYTSTTGAIINTVTSKDIDITSPTGFANESSIYFVDVQLEAGKTYTIERSLTVKSGTLSSRTGDVELYKDSTWLKVLLSANVSRTTFTIDETSTYRIRLFVSPASVTEEFRFIVSNFMIYEGTENKPYEQYGASPSIDYPSEIESVGDNVNLFDKDNVNLVYSNDSTFEKIENGLRITASADNTGTMFCLFKIMDVFNFVGETFALSADWLTSASNNGQIIIGLCDENGENRLAGTQMRTSGGTSVYTIPEITTSKYLAIWLYANVSGTTYNGDYVDYSNIKIVQGTIATPYSPYGQGSIEIKQDNGLETTDTNYKLQTKVSYTQQPLRSIGDVRDKFIKKNGVWYEEHNIGEVILDGTEEWIGGSYSTGSTKYRYFYTTVPQTNSFNSLCNRLKPYTKNVLASGTVKDNVIGFSTSATNNLRIIFDETLLEDTSTTALAISSFKTWLTKNNLTVDYILATPTLIECTPEQVEQLEYFEKDAYSYDGVTIIYSTDKISPVFDVSAYKKISDEFKTRLKQGKITRGYLKVLSTDTQEEFIIDENNYLKDLKIQELRYIPDEGFIGGTVAKKLSGNFNNVDSSFSIQDREIEAYLGVDLIDGTTEYIKYGTYIVQAPEDNQVNDNTSFEALDYMIKFNQVYEDRMTYPCTMKQLLDDIADQAGVNSKVGTFLNEDFIVENNQFESGTTLRDVLKAIAQMAFNWSRVDEEDNLVFDFEIKDDADEIILSDEYFNYTKSNEYGPVNTIILRNSQVEGENVTIKDEESISSIGEVELVIADNPFAYTQEKRTQLIEAGKKLFGLRYTPMSMDMIGLMYLNAKDRIGATNPNGETFYTYLLDHTIDYNGVVLDSMESQAKTKTETKYQFTPQVTQAIKRTEILVDKANQQIQSIISEQVEIEEKVAKTVSKIEVFYALGDNSTTAPTTDWSTVAPEWQEGSYMWQKTITTYTDGTVVESEPTNISGASGKDGTSGKDGVGVKEITTQYYLSNSNETQAGGEWKETQDSWEEGKYIWTRTKVTWTNNTITYTNPILATTLNELNSTVVDIGTDLAQSKKDLQVRVKYIEDNGVDKVLTTMGYTFDNEGLKINKTNATTGTLIDETAVQVIDKSGSSETDILYAGYVKESNTKYADYVGQTIVSAANLIVRNYLVIGDSSRFESYKNPTLGGTGTGAFDI